MSEPTKPDAKFATKVVVISIIAIFLLVIIANANADKYSYSDKYAERYAEEDELAATEAALNKAVDEAGAAAEVAAEAVTAENEEEAASDKGKWYYDESRDELRNATIYRASLPSNNKAYFGFPYSGGSQLDITVRKHPKYGTDVIFQISSGQFACGVYDCRGTISFDGKAEGLTLSQPETYEPTALFATYGSAILRKIKTSERVVVELPFYQEGRQQFVFDTSGLEWDH